MLAAVMQQLQPYPRKLMVYRHSHMLTRTPAVAATLCTCVCIFAAQVRSSASTSLRNLATDYLDSLLLHSPCRTHEQTMQGMVHCSWPYCMQL
jgi:hypothetical protein